MRKPSFSKISIAYYLCKLKNRNKYYILFINMCKVSKSINTHKNQIDLRKVVSFSVGGKARNLIQT